MNKRLVRAVLPLLALGAIGYGAWMAYPPAGPIVVGLLLWVDLTIGTVRK